MAVRPSATQIRRFQRQLLAWYRDHARDLPWRRTRNPYRILVSEMMLQQTQVERVRKFYGRFLSRYPNFASLAAASEPAVRESWEGLGYYARARHLHQTARLVIDHHGGQLPDDAKRIRSLPGIGRYTAGAVLSIAYGKDEPILDTNAARVLRRVFGIRSRGGKTQSCGRLWQVAARVTPAGKADVFNQAIMDLGATVCRSRNPACQRCPLRTTCRARRQYAGLSPHYSAVSPAPVRSLRSKPSNERG